MAQPTGHSSGIVVSRPIILSDSKHDDATKTGYTTCKAFDTDVTRLLSNTILACCNRDKKGAVAGNPAAILAFGAQELDLSSCRTSDKQSSFELVMLQVAATLVAGKHAGFVHGTSQSETTLGQKNPLVVKNAISCATYAVIGRHIVLESEQEWHINIATDGYVLPGVGLTKHTTNMAYEATCSFKLVRGEVFRRLVGGPVVLLTVAYFAASNQENVVRGDTRFENFAQAVLKASITQFANLSMDEIIDLVKRVRLDDVVKSYLKKIVPLGEPMDTYIRLMDYIQSCWKPRELIIRQGKGTSR